MKVGILGAGAWGTALAVALSARHQVTLWAREAGLPENIRSTRENQQFLPGVMLPDSVNVTADLEQAIRGDLIIAASSVAGLRPTFRQLCAAQAGAPILWLCKGFETGSAKLPHQIAAEELPGGTRYGALSGPSFAIEVARGLPVALTLASPDADFALRTAAHLHGGMMRIYSCSDLPGVEVGGAVKNVMAIATGISDGLGLGHNARAALITRGLAEMARLGVALGGKMETFMGLTGMGDLILTATGDLSRNRTVGLKLASAQNLDDVLGGLGHVAEGVYSARETLALARQLGVDMPITRAVCAVLFEGALPRDAVAGLLAREARSE